jgi:dihydrofolate reductase
VSIEAGAADGRRASFPHPIAVVLIAAVAENGVIGRANQLPWRLKSDMQHFRRITMGKPVVMGRKTFQSLFRPLAGRTVIVVTRDRDFAAPGAVIAHSLDAALAAARGDALRRGADAIMVAGGADVYAQAMPIADRLLVTRVQGRPEGDAVFPAIDDKVWRESEIVVGAQGPDDSAAFAFLGFGRTTG